eukprot:650380-Amphidinium_carterae.2
MGLPPCGALRRKSRLTLALVMIDMRLLGICGDRILVPCDLFRVSPRTSEASRTDEVLPIRVRRAAFMSLLLRPKASLNDRRARVKMI